MIFFKDIFKKMDTMIFKFADAMNGFGPWLQLVDRFRVLNETQQKWANHLISLLVVLAPLLILIMITSYNQKISADVQLKEQLLSSIDNLSKIKGEYATLERLKISRTSITSSDDVESALRKLFEGKEINWEKISISNYQKEETAQGLNISRFRFAFRGFTNHDLTQSLSLMIEREKVAISNLSIRKDTKDNTVEGQFEVTHYSKGY